ncbi:hypothetical protein FHG64_10335 [Antarcticibacterium flavum]|uniref:NlpE C-terminal OB domain-containing protein n=1 Tax=Antarcticibacterium flavum TaxID=2058175 RepID=A0A5B7X2I7_9FLAO|nr:MULTISPECIES: hypothetical protein [Antarcticibacterium]MCM4160574.1 hypothetical protein [Antarcticibacterium sp. W02-3]QCY69764.1 hypothetical protein FHG64_10335 [Antarcticibacterium flavum]
MKKLLFILTLVFLISSCESEQGTASEPSPVMTAEDSIKVYEGNFITAGNAAVLKGNQFVYMVKIDSISTNLKQDLKNYQDNNGGVFPVKVKGKVTDNPMPAGYSQIIEIKEVLEITGKKETQETEVQK